MSAQDWAKRFDDSYTPAESPTRQAVMREALGDEYPEGLDPNSFVTLSELQRYARDLRVGDGDLLADAACGRGGPGLWVAAQTGARLVGIDFAPSAIEYARDRAEAAGMSDRAEFRVARFEETGLADAAADAIMSVDALIFSEDKPAAVRELHRILRPGGRFVFSSWDYSGQVPWRPLMLDDHRPCSRKRASTSSPTTRPRTGRRVKPRSPTGYSNGSTRSPWSSAPIRRSRGRGSSRCAKEWQR